MPEFRPLPAVQCILDWWLPRMLAVVGQQPVSVLLSGSVVLGDYCDGWSDVDVCVVLPGDVTPEAGAAVGHVHDQMRDEFAARPDWRSGQFMEGYYVPEALCHAPDGKGWCYVAGGSTRKHFPGNPVTPFDRYMLAHHSVAVHGSPVRFTPPAQGDLARQTREDLATLSGYEGQSSIWLCGMLHWLARTVVFWRDGVMLSKTAALEKEIAAKAVLCDAYAIALTARKEGSANAAKYRPELLRLYPKAVEWADAQVAALVGRAGESRQ